MIRVSLLLFLRSHKCLLWSHCSGFRPEGGVAGRAGGGGWTIIGDIRSCRSVLDPVCCSCNLVMTVRNPNFHQMTVPHRFLPEPRRRAGSAGSRSTRIASGSVNPAGSVMQDRSSQRFDQKQTSLQVPSVNDSVNQDERNVVSFSFTRRSVFDSSEPTLFITSSPSYRGKAQLLLAFVKHRPSFNQSHPCFWPSADEWPPLFLHRCTPSNWLSSLFVGGRA